MKMLHTKMIISAFIFCICFSLKQISWAQNSLQMPSGLPTSSVNVTNPTSPSPPTNPSQNNTATPGLNANEKKDQVPLVKKYAERKSICIDLEKESNEIKSENVKKSRIELLLKKREEAKQKNNVSLLNSIHILLIQEYLKQKDIKKAESEYNQVNLNLSDLDRVLISAEIDIFKKLYRSAMTNLNNYLEKNPKEIKVLEQIAKVYKLQENYTSAYTTYEDLSKIVVRPPGTKKDYTVYLCETASLNADHTTTEVQCTKLISKKNEESYLGYAYLGVSLRDQSDYKKASDLFQQSLKIKPNEFASTCLAETLFLLEKYPESIKQYEETILLSPESKRSHIGLAEALSKISSYEKALEQYKKACEKGLKPLASMMEIANKLKAQKLPLATDYTDEIQKCKNRPD